jgi:hypothetical protein
MKVLNKECYNTKLLIKDIPKTFDLADKADIIIQSEENMDKVKSFKSYLL